MTFHNQNRYWPALIGLMACFLWTAQTRVDWRSQLDDTAYAQRSDVGFAQVIEPERNTTSRELTPERRPESSGLTASDATVEASFLRSRIRPGSSLVAGDIQPVALPAIRAPPQFITSA